MIMVNIPQIYLGIYDKYCSTSFKQRLPFEFHRKITFNIVIIIFPLDALVAWQRGLGADLPSRWFRFDSLLSCFSLLYKFASFRFVLFCFVLFLFLIILYFPQGWFPFISFATVLR